MGTKDIRTSRDIEILVNTFYGKVRKDELLAPIFNTVIQDNWEVHLKKMYTFWGTVLLGERRYFGNPFLPHAALPIGKSHFEAWIALFYETLDELFVGGKADEAKWRAAKMAEMFRYKIEAYRKSRKKPLL